MTIDEVIDWMVTDVADRVVDINHHKMMEAQASHAGQFKAVPETRIRNLVVMGSIGAGAYGNVVRVLNRWSGRMSALKIINSSQEFSQSAQDEQDVVKFIYTRMNSARGRSTMRSTMRSMVRDAFAAFNCGEVELCRGRTRRCGSTRRSARRRLASVASRGLAKVRRPRSTTPSCRRMGR